MSLNLTRPLVILDTETTGTSIYTDRIVEFAATRFEPGKKPVKGCQRFNPEMPIPKEASEVHHITNEDVAQSPKFRDKAESILKFLSGCDFAGYNIKKFDLPLLEAEFKRVGITTFSWRDKTILDAYSIWLKAEPRDLGSAVKTFLGKEHAGAHGAEADTAVVMDLLEAFVKKWNLPTDPKSLYEWADPPNPDAFDSEGKLIWKDTELVFTFGKNNGRTLRELAKNDPSFLEWILGKDFSDTVKNAVKGTLAGRHPVRKK